MESATGTEEDLKKCEIERDHYKSQSLQSLKEIEEMKTNLKIKEEVMKAINFFIFFTIRFIIEDEEE